MEHYGIVAPIIVAPNGMIIDGEARFAEAEARGYTEAPVAIVEGFSDAEIKALRLGLNRLGERGEWINDALGLDLTEILEADPLFAGLTGFEMPEIDLLALPELQRVADDEEIPALPARAISKLGDKWVIGHHSILCGDAKDKDSYGTALGGQTVQMVLADAPYLCKIANFVSRRHGEFVEGSGLKEADFIDFISKALAAADPHIPPGCIVDLFMDGRGLFALITASRAIGLEQLCVVAWDKVSAGMGGLYRNQIESVLVFKKPGARHINNVSLGKFGRNRSTLWRTPGYAGFGAERDAALKRHPTCKPVALLKDAIIDVTHVGGVVLDMFCGSGSTLVAAHQVKRVGVGIELDPLYVDQSVRRLEKVTGLEAVHVGSGLTFSEVARSQRHALVSE